MTPKQARHSLGMSINNFADALGVRPNTARRWEMPETAKQHRRPSEQTWRLIRIMQVGGSVAHDAIKTTNNI